MKIAVPKETLPGERRVALVPESIKKLTGKGITIAVEHDAGAAAYFADADFESAGATIESDIGGLLSSADLVLQVQPPTFEQIDQMKSGAMLLTTLTPTRNTDVIRKLVEKRISAFFDRLCGHARHAHSRWTRFRPWPTSRATKQSSSRRTSWPSTSPCS